VRDLLDLYCLAYEYEVRDLLWRCEEEINLKVTPGNVLCILVKYYTTLDGHETLPNAQESEEPPSSASSSGEEEHKNAATQID
jgi:hypothetical protein